MDDEKLIELVRDKTVLYDLSHPKYMDPKFKMSIWQSIGAEMNITGKINLLFLCIYLFHFYKWY